MVDVQMPANEQLPVLRVEPGKDEGVKPGKDKGVEPGKDEGVEPGKDEAQSQMCDESCSFRLVEEHCVPELKFKG